MPPSTMNKKLAEAASAVETVSKAGKNTQQNYNYATAEDVAAAATKALADAGLHVRIEFTQVESNQVTSRSGGSGMIATVHGALIVSDGNGSELRLETMGSGSDYPGDKAIYKAMTGARKYGLIHLLDIPIGDDPEEERTQAKPKKMPAAEAKKIVEAAWAIPAAKDALRLAASHVADGRDVGDCDTKQKAQKAIGSLSAQQGERLRDWIQTKAEPDA